MWLLFSLISAIGGACVALLVKSKLTTIDPLLLACVQFFGMFLILLGVCCLQQKIGAVSLINNRQWVYITLTSSIAALAYASYFLALKYGIATHVVAIDRLSIIVLMLLSFVIFGNTVTLSSLFGAFLVVLGTILIVR